MYFLNSLIFAHVLQIPLAFDFRLPVFILFSSCRFKLISKGLPVMVVPKRSYISHGFVWLSLQKKLFATVVCNKPYPIPDWSESTDKHIILLIKLKLIYKNHKPWILVSMSILKCIVHHKYWGHWTPAAYLTMLLLFGASFYCALKLCIKREVSFMWTMFYFIFSI